MMAMLDSQIAKLDIAAERAAREHPQARLLVTQPGVGPITALAFVVTMGDVGAFREASRWPAISG